jgi:predicted sugar kinase
MSQPKIEIEDTSDEDVDIEIDEASDEELDIEIEESTEDKPNIEIEDEEEYEEYTEYDSYEKLSLDETSSSSTLTEELKKLGDDVFKGEKFLRILKNLHSK